MSGYVPEEASLQRLFSTFPGGLPGTGLLLLRGLIGVTLISQAVAYLNSAGLNPLGWTIAGAVAICGACLLLGFMTPLMAAFAGVLALGFALSWLPLPPDDSLSRNRTLVDLIIMAAALATLGPGAFSVDARMFGRRVIRIPSSTYENSPHA